MNKLNEYTEAALTRLQALYQSIRLTNSTFYLCRSISGTSFSMSIFDDGSLEISRFLGVVAPECEVTKLERQFEDHVAILDSIEDQTYNYIERQTLEEEKCPQQILRRIAGFLLTSTRMEQGFIAIGLEPDTDDSEEEENEDEDEDSDDEEIYEEFDDLYDDPYDDEDD